MTRHLNFGAVMRQRTRKASRQLTENLNGSACAHLVVTINDACTPSAGQRCMVVLPVVLGIMQSVYLSRINHQQTPMLLPTHWLHLLTMRTVWQTSTLYSGHLLKLMVICWHQLVMIQWSK